ncbi:MAG: PAS domain S-box protein [Isosphaeraceae bacterium]|jgi:PAS domain S-box-containing protein
MPTQPDSSSNACTERLRPSAECYRLLVDAVKDYAIFMLDPTGLVVTWNTGAEHIKGYRAAEAIGKHFSLFYTPEDVASGKPERELEIAAAEGRLEDDGCRVRKDGSRFWVNVVITAFRNDAGELMGFVQVIRDMTEQRARDYALREAEERMRSVVNHVIDGIITIDERGLVESFNPAAEKTFGYPAGEVVGRNVSMLMPEPHHSGHDGYLANYFRTHQSKIIGIGREVEGVRSDGSIFPMELAVSEFNLAGRRYFTGIIRDITERQRLERELHKRVAELDETGHRKDEFLAMLAHELRNPLAAIITAVQLSTMSGVQDQINWSMEVINRQVKHLTRLIDDLLDVSRITRGKVELRKEKIDAYPVINGALEAIRPLIKQRNHELIVSLQAGLRLDADPTRLEQILVNLLANAAKYTESGGTIWFTAGHEGNDIVIKVRDTGIGIPPEKLPQMFELFAQGDRSLARSEGGLGIGLTLVRSLAEMHGGSVTATSEGPGKGSEFMVRLPAVAARAEEIPRLPAKTPQANAHRARILIVDDNVDMVRGLVRLLELLGHDVQTAYDGPTAVEAARVHRPEFVLLDLGLPGMDGYQVATRLRQEQGSQDAVIIAVTGYGQEDDRCRSREAGFDHHLVKPIDHNVLVTLISQSQDIID